MGIEIQILDWIQGLRTPAGDVFWTLVTKLGNAGFIWIVLAIILLFIPRTRKSGLVLVTALCVDVVLCNGLLKNLFARVRPYEINDSVQLLVAKPIDFSFPSGHTAASFATAAVLYFTKEKVLWKPVLLLAILIAFSRLYLYVHYPTDVLGGIVVGVIAGYMGYRFTNGLEQWRKKR